MNSFLLWEGSNTNNSGGKDFILRRYQAISIPPGTRHRTVVTTGLWKGLSFYCDDCPLLFENPPEARTDIVIKSLDDRVSVLNHLQKKPIFSPASQESCLMELYFLFSNSPVPATHFMHAGETVLLCDFRRGITLLGTSLQDRTSIRDGRCNTRRVFISACL